MATFFQKITEHARGVRFRLALVYSVLFGVCLTLFALFLTNEHLRMAHEENDHSLRSLAIDLGNFVKVGPSTFLSDFDQTVSQQVLLFPFAIQETFVTVRSIDGTILYTNSKSEIPYNSMLAYTKGYSHRFFDFQDAVGKKLRAVNLKIDGQNASYIIQVAAPTKRMQNLERNHLFLLLFIIPVTILITALTSVLVAGRALLPIHTTIEQMEELLQTEAYRPLPVPKTHDEIERLTRTFNFMLENLQRTLEAQEQFVANASHQLKTPLAIMRGELEVLNSKARTPDEISNFHQSLSQELHRLTLLVQDMLLVSRVEAGKAHFHFSEIDFEEIVVDVVARLSFKAKQLGLQLKLDLEFNRHPMLQGEAQLLDTLVENLIGNALKYSPAGGRVHVKLYQNEKSQIAFEVEDNGPGIPNSILDQMNHPKRFNRGKDSGTKAGSGLGLYLIKTIANYHNAELIFEKKSPGTLARVIFNA